LTQDRANACQNVLPLQPEAVVSVCVEISRPVIQSLLPGNLAGFLSSGNRYALVKYGRSYGATLFFETIQSFPSAIPFSTNVQTTYPTALPPPTMTNLYDELEFDHPLPLERIWN
jgi:hypothetical protein